MGGKNAFKPPRIINSGFRGWGLYIRKGKTEHNKTRIKGNETKAKEIKGNRRQEIEGNKRELMEMKGNKGK